VLQLDELRDSLSSMEAKMASLTAVNLSLQRPKTPAAKVWSAGRLSSADVTFWYSHLC